MHSFFRSNLRIYLAFLPDFPKSEKANYLVNCVVNCVFDSGKGLVYKSKIVLENEADPVPAPPAPDAVALVGMNLKMQAEMESKRLER